MAGPLSGYRIIEVAGIGPGPFAAMLAWWQRRDPAASVGRQAATGHEPVPQLLKR